MARWLLLIALSTALTGCGALASQQAGPTPRPTVTVTPMSTPLVYPSTPPPVGSFENPIRWVMVPADSEAAEPLREVLAAVLSETLGAAFEVELVTTQAEVIEQVCSPLLDRAVMGTVDAVGYAIVSARGCAMPALRLVSDGARGDEVLIVARQAESLEAARSLNLPFCRLSSADLESWVLPLLLLRTLRQDESVLGQPLDRRSHTESLRTISGGGCWGAAVPGRVFDALRAAGNPLVEGMRVLERTPRLPFGVVVIPASVPSNLRARLTALLEGQARLSASAALEAAPDPGATPDFEAAVTSLTDLAPAFFGSFQLAAVDTGDLEVADRFFAQTRLDFARLGR